MIFQRIVCKIVFIFILIAYPSQSRSLNETYKSVLIIGHLFGLYEVYGENKPSLEPDNLIPLINKVNQIPRGKRFFYLEISM